MISTVHFFRLPGSRLLNEFFIRQSSGAVPDGYFKKAVGEVRCTSNLEQTITVPYWDGYQDVNTVKITETGDFYWIVSADEEVRADVHTVRFFISYNAPTTQLRAGSNIKGEWMRSPTKVTSYLSEPVMDSEFVPVQSVRLPNIVDNIGLEVPAHLLWVEITSTVSRSGSASPIQDKLSRYGLFCYYDPDNPYRQWLNVYATANMTSAEEYPSLMQVVSDPDQILGIPASTITNISVSERCPYSFFYYTSSQTGEFLNVIQLQNKSGTALVPNVDFLYTPSQTHYMYYNLTPLSANESQTPKTSGWEEFTLSAREDELDVGRVTISSTDNQVMATVPTRFFVPDTEHTGYRKITLEARAISDFNGIVTHVRFPFDKDVIVMNEGKLPWVGSAWEEYKAYEQAYDRQAVQNANQLALLSTAGQIVGSFVPGTVVGSLTGSATAGAMTAGANALGSLFDYGVSVLGRQMEQELKEKRVSGQAGTGYQTGYGLVYCLMSAVLGARITLEKPYLCTSAIYDDFHARHGFPSEGVYYLTIGEGFVQGIPDNRSDSPKDERLTALFVNGFRMIE